MLDEASLLEGLDAGAQASALKALEAVAAPLKAAKDATLFYYATAAGSVSDQVRKLTGLSGGGPALVLLDIPDNGGDYVGEGGEVSEDSVKELLLAYKGKTLTRKQLS